MCVEPLDVRGDLLDLREKELAIRELKADMISKTGYRRWSDPLVIAVVGAAVAVVGNLISGYYQANQALHLEKEKERAILIQEIVKTGNVDRAKDNIRFLLKAGILADPAGKIAKALESGIPIVLPSGHASIVDGRDVSLGEGLASPPHVSR